MQSQWLEKSNAPLSIKYEDCKAVVQNLLISAPRGLLLRQLLQDYQECEGLPLPYLSLGFSNPESLLRSMNDVVSLQCCGNTITLVAKSTPETEHIRQFVVEQKSSRAGRLGGSSLTRRGGGHSNRVRERTPSARRRRPLSVPPSRNSSNNTDGHMYIVPPYIQKNIKELLLMHRHGIPLEYIGAEYEKKYGFPLRIPFNESRRRSFFNSMSHFCHVRLQRDGRMVVAINEDLAMTAFNKPKEHSDGRERRNTISMATSTSCGISSKLAPQSNNAAVNDEKYKRESSVCNGHLKTLTRLPDNSSSQASNNKNFSNHDPEKASEKNRGTFDLNLRENKFPGSDSSAKVSSPEVYSVASPNVLESRPRKSAGRLSLSAIVLDQTLPSPKSAPCLLESDAVKAADRDKNVPAANVTSNSAYNEDANGEQESLDYFDYSIEWNYNETSEAKIKAENEKSTPKTISNEEKSFDSTSASYRPSLARPKIPSHILKQAWTRLNEKTSTPLIKNETKQPRSNVNVINGNDRPKEFHDDAKNEISCKHETAVSASLINNEMHLDKTNKNQVAETSNEGDRNACVVKDSERFVMFKPSIYAGTSKASNSSLVVTVNQTIKKTINNELNSGDGPIEFKGKGDIAKISYRSTTPRYIPENVMRGLTAAVKSMSNSHTISPHQIEQAYKIATGESLNLAILGLSSFKELAYAVPNLLTVVESSCNGYTINVASKGQNNVAQKPLEGPESRRLAKTLKNRPFGLSCDQLLQAYKVDWPAHSADLWYAARGYETMEDLLATAPARALKLVYTELTCDVAGRSSPSHRVSVFPYDAQLPISHKPDDATDSGECGALLEHLAGPDCELPADTENPLLQVGGSVEGVMLGEMYSPRNFGVICNMAGLDELMDDLEKYYNYQYTQDQWQSLALLDEYYKPGQLVAANDPKDEVFYRAVIRAIKPNGKAQVLLVDFGKTFLAERYMLLHLPLQFTKQPPFALRACLYGVWTTENSSTRWKSGTLTRFVSFVLDRKLRATTIAIQGSTVLLKLVDPSSDGIKDIAKRLVCEGFAMHITELTMPELTVKNACDSDDASNIDKKAKALQTTELTSKNSMVFTDASVTEQDKKATFENSVKAEAASSDASESSKLLVTSQGNSANTLASTNACDLLKAESSSHDIPAQSTPTSSSAPTCSGSTAPMHSSSCTVDVRLSSSDDVGVEDKIQRTQGDSLDQNSKNLGSSASTQCDAIVDTNPGVFTLDQLIQLRDSTSPVVKKVTTFQAQDQVDPNPTLISMPKQPTRLVPQQYISNYSPVARSIYNGRTSGLQQPKVSPIRSAPLMQPSGTVPNHPLPQHYYHFAPVVRPQSSVMPLHFSQPPAIPLHFPHPQALPQPQAAMMIATRPSLMPTGQTALYQACPVPPLPKTVTSLASGRGPDKMETTLASLEHHRSVLLQQIMMRPCDQGLMKALEDITANIWRLQALKRTNV
ncbi:uncharacterized protein LOC108671171 isoform X2 [Hyalella azteca]|uniref:Uncharacterized protein LOC108671171 isoform X2 n=1 Tax=Hyalella azteca TaxID=294128 RepID=A0A8B7NKG9_HYAAZ|nr:uncharacterized protein LOC108671171 isoform X2 [Hyalella azteca]